MSVVSAYRIKAIVVVFLEEGGREGARTSVVSVVLLASSTSIASVLSIGAPVSHATQLVALGEWGVGNAVEGGFGGDSGPPSIAVGQRRDEVGD